MVAGAGAMSSQGWTGTGGGFGGIWGSRAGSFCLRFGDGFERRRNPIFLCVCASARVQVVLLSHCSQTCLEFLNCVICNPITKT